MSGHVFVTCGNLGNLACDAWLLPTDEYFSLTHHWRELSGPQPAAPEGWASDGVRAVLGPGHPDDSRDTWWVNVGSVPGEDIGWFVAGAAEFVRRAAERRGQVKGVWRRAKPLLALPLIGTGKGGAAREAGRVLVDLFPRLEELARVLDADLVLVTRTLEAHAAAQAVRRRCLDDAAWAKELGQPLAAHAERLARYAERKQLVLFIGAGVSVAAGLPDWTSLLDQLAKDAGLSDDERKGLAKLDALDRARLVESRIGPGQLGGRIRSMLTGRRLSLAHTLLAALPTAETATTNYDQLFEQASTDCGTTCAVLPYQPATGQGRWLLKLHGCIEHPDDIVLTRDDYLQYSERRAALTGIVQALLVTRHMLFVGFSLKDENFHRVAHDVRMALRGGERPAGQSLGTALLLHGDALLQELWRPDIDIVPMAPPGDPSSDEAAARRLEIFLDALGLFACNGVDYLLNDSYRHALTEDELHVKRALVDIERKLPASAWNSAPGRRLEAFLRDLGGAAQKP